MEAPATTQPARGSRRWWRVSLGTLMVAILVVSFPLGWQARRANLQRRGVAAVQRLGGEITYDWQYGGNRFVRTTATEPPGPRWLRRWVGDEYFQEVAQVDLPAQIPVGPELGDSPTALEDWAEANRRFEERVIRPVQDDQLACLAGLDQVQCVVLQAGQLGPDGVARLARLPRLRELHATVSADPNVRAGLSKLGHLEALSLLWPVNEAPSDLAFLDALPRLQGLILTYQGPLAEADAARIGRLADLRSLSLLGPDVDDASLATIGRLRGLQMLMIASSAGITSDGVTRLVAMPELQLLTLTQTALTDARLDLLCQMPKLSVVAMEDGGLDPNHRAACQAARPSLQLSLHPPLAARAAGLTPAVPLPPPPP